MQPAPFRVLILSVSAGAGHQRAAEAIAAHAARHFPQAEIRHLDAMQFVSAAFRKLYTDLYLKLISKAPGLWGYLYQFSHDAQQDSKTERLRRALERLNARPLLKAVREYGADAVICTHFLPAEILSRLKHQRRLPCPVWIQITDFDLHRMWIQPGVAGYFAPNEEIAFRLRMHGVPAQRIHVTGIPVMPGFVHPPTRAHSFASLPLQAERPTLLLMSGGAGLGNAATLAEQLLQQRSDIQLIVLTGKNALLLQQCQALQTWYPQRLLAVSFTSQVEHYMACADIVISKPGGLTSSECLAMGVPMIVHDPIPGQEERNANYLLEQGVALHAWDFPSLLYRLQTLLDHPDMMKRMCDKARALGRPAAALQVLHLVLSHADQKVPYESATPAAVNMPSDLCEPAGHRLCTGRNSD